MMTFSPAKLSGARSSEIPRQLTPMLAKSGEEPFDGDDWVFDIKIDGYRALAQIDRRRVRLYSRNNLTMNERFPEVIAELEKLPFDTVLDGELAVLDSKDRPDFQLIQKYSSRIGTPVYFVFDILFFEGYDLRGVELLSRKKILDQLISGKGTLRATRWQQTNGKELFQEAKTAGFEGVIAKLAHGKYLSGTRSPEWLKIKATKEDEAIICGYTESGAGLPFASLILGRYQNGKIIYSGSVGTGFSDLERAKLLKEFRNYETDTSPFEEIPELELTPIWMRPKLVCQIKYTERTDSGAFRHPVFRGIRQDKLPKEVN